MNILRSMTGNVYQSNISNNTFDMLADINRVAERSDMRQVAVAAVFLNLITPAEASSGLSTDQEIGAIVGICMFFILVFICRCSSLFCDSKNKLPTYREAINKPMTAEEMQVNGYPAPSYSPPRANTPLLEINTA